MVGKLWLISNFDPKKSKNKIQGAKTKAERQNKAKKLALMKNPKA